MVTRSANYGAMTASYTLLPVYRPGSSSAQGKIEQSVSGEGTSVYRQSHILPYLSGV